MINKMRKDLEGKKGGSQQQPAGKRQKTSGYSHTFVAIGDVDEQDDEALDDRYCA